MWLARQTLRGARSLRKFFSRGPEPLGSSLSKTGQVLTVHRKDTMATDCPVKVIRSVPHRSSARIIKVRRSQHTHNILRALVTKNHIPRPPNCTKMPTKVFPWNSNSKHNTEFQYGRLFWRLTRHSAFEKKRLRFFSYRPSIVLFLFLFDESAAGDQTKIMF